MFKFLIVLSAAFLMCCGEFDVDVEDIDVSGDALVIDKNYCFGGDKREIYDYYQGSRENEFLIGENICYYEDGRISYVEIYDYLQGDPNGDYLIGMISYTWRKDSLLIEKRDFIQGYTGNDYIVGIDICYF